MVERRAEGLARRARQGLVLPLAFLLALAVGSALGAPSRPPGLAGSGFPEATSDANYDLARPPAPPDLPGKYPFPRINPETSIDRAWLLAEGPAPRPGDGRRYVTFTFDDGPFPETTPAILRVLAQHRIHATFFVVGQYLLGAAPRAEQNRQIVRDMMAQGHLIGNHTRDHRFLPALDHGEVLAQIDDTSSALEEITGKRPLFFRPPFGKLDPFSRAFVHDRGLELVLWSIEVADMKNDDPTHMAESLKRQLEFKGGGIVLLHDIRPATLPTFKRVLEHLRRRRWDPARPERTGFEIVDLPAYLRRTEESPQPHASRDALEGARMEAHRKLHPDEVPPRRAPAERKGSEALVF